MRKNDICYIKRYFILLFLVIILAMFVNRFDLRLLGDCDNVILNELASNDNKVIVTLFRRDCGATTDYATLISLRYIYENFNPNPDNSIFIIGGENYLNIKWIKNDILYVYISEENKIFKMENKWYSVQISYIY